MVARFAPQPCGLLNQTVFSGRPRQQLGLVLGNLNELIFQGMGEAGMERPSRLAGSLQVERQDKPTRAGPDNRSDKRQFCDSNHIVYSNPLTI